jgi:hypothetical protein
MQHAMALPQLTTHPMGSGSAKQPPMAAMASARLRATQDSPVLPHLHLQPAAQGTGLQSVAHVNPLVSTLLDCVIMMFEPLPFIMN